MRTAMPRPPRADTISAVSSIVSRRPAYTPVAGCSRVVRPVQYTVAPPSPSMHAIPRPAPRVAPATRAIFPSSGRDLFSAARIAHLLERRRARGLARAHAPRGLLDHARQRPAGERRTRPNLDVAHGLAGALEESLGIGKTRTFAEAQVDVLRVADDVTERFPLDAELRRAVDPELVVARSARAHERDE